MAVAVCCFVKSSPITQFGCIPACPTMEGERERTPRKHMCTRSDSSTKRTEAPDVLPCGKHKGTAINNVPAPYLIGLCCWQMAATSRCGDPDCACDSLRCFRVAKFRDYKRGDDDWRHWLKRTHPRIVALARRYVRENHLCHHCGNTLFQ